MKKSFDRVAWIYDKLAGWVFGKSIKTSQTSLLPELPKGGKLLIVGGGTGWILPALFQQAKPEHIFYVDSSGKMIELAQKSFESLGLPSDRITFFTQPFGPGVVTEEVDIVITNFYLDLFPPQTLPEQMALLHRLLKPNGTWLFTDFQYPKGGISRFFSRLLIPLMYLFFKIFTGIPASHLPDFESEFHQLGLKNEMERFFYGQMIRTAIYRKA